MTSARARKAVVPGKKTGKKRSDYHWTAPDGGIWDSKFEYEVFSTAQQALLPVRRARKGRPDIAGSDTFSYFHPSRLGKCRSCGSAEVGTVRSYTPDLFHESEVLPSARDDKGRQAGADLGYFVDVKGFLRAPKRALLRSFVKARNDVNLRLILQRDFRVSATSTFCQWIDKRLKIPYAIWDGKWPTKWVMPCKTK